MRRLLAALALATVAGAQELAEVRWGYDGHVVDQRFALLSVRVDNPGSEPFSGELRLWRTAEFAPSRLGAEIVEPCFLAPRSSRWIALYPFIAEASSRWTLRVGRASKELDAPPIGAPAVVLLADDVATARTALPVFPAARFPATVLGTDGLAAVVLSEVPDWDPKHREAFLHWVHQGGRVHVLARGGRHARFGGDLAVLDGDDDRHAYGQGLVVREPADVTAMDARRFAAPATLRPLSAPEAAQSLLSELQVSVAMRFDWPLILFCAFAYLLVVGPVHWYLAARRLGAAASLGALVAIVGVFGLLLHLLGRRGTDEQGFDVSLAYARAIAPDRLQVLQFNDVFVTAGDRYHIGAGDDDALFSTAQLYEAVPAVVRGGKDGAIDVDVPVYSHRSIVHAATLLGTVPKATLPTWPDRAADLRFALERTPAPATRAVAIWRGSAYTLAVDGAELIATGDVQRSDADGAQPLAGADAPDSAALDPERLLQCAVDATPMPPADRVDLLLLMPAPPGFELRGTGAARRQAFVLYHLRFGRDR